MESIVETHSKLCKEWMERDQKKNDTVLESMEAIKKCAIMRAVDGKPNWLTVMSIACH